MSRVDEWSGVEAGLRDEPPEALTTPYAVLTVDSEYVTQLRERMDLTLVERAFLRGVDHALDELNRRGR